MKRVLLIVAAVLLLSGLVAQFPPIQRIWRHVEAAARAELGLHGEVIPPK